jgi:HPt (histidine-containing phosphotransfer) domain-containing protein
MNESMEKVQEQIEAIQKDYIRDLPAAIASIEDIWNELQDNWRTGALKNLYNSIHRIAGSGGTFGFPELSEISLEIEKLLNPFLFEGSSPHADDLTRIDNYINKLKQVSAEYRGADWYIQPEYPIRQEQDK